jgi:hypothetical protein
MAAVQYTLTHKQLTPDGSSTVHIYTQTVDTRWQQYSTHLHTNSTQNTEKGTYITITREKNNQKEKNNNYKEKIGK